MRRVAPALLFVLGLVLGGCSRTTAVELDDGHGARVRVPSQDAPVTAVAFCTAARVDPCRELAGRSRELASAGVAVVILGSSEPGTLDTQPLPPPAVSELRRLGAAYAIDLTGVARG